MIKSLIFIYMLIASSKTFGSAEVAIKAFEEALDFVNGLTGLIAKEKLEKERLKKELINLARKNTDIKLNQVVKITNMISIIKLKIKLLSYISLYSEYENSINIKLQNKIDSLFKQIEQLSTNNLDLFLRTSKKELLSTYNYILDDGFNTYFTIYKDYFIALSKINTAFNPNLKNVNININNNFTNNTIYNNPLFIENTQNIINNIQNKYKINDTINIQYQISLNELRNYFSTIFFTAADDINKKIEELLLKESNRDLNETFYDLTLTIARIDAILFSKIDKYIRELELLDDNCYKMYFILKKIFIENTWIIESLKKSTLINDDINELKNIIQNIEKQNKLEQKKFKKKFYIKNEYFESLIKDLNIFTKNLITFQDQSDEINPIQWQKIFKNNIDPNILLEKCDIIINLIQKEILKIETKKNFFINEISLLYNVNLTEEDLITNMEIYKTIQEKQTNFNKNNISENQINENNNEQNIINDKINNLNQDEKHDSLITSTQEEYLQKKVNSIITTHFNIHNNINKSNNHLSKQLHTDNQNIKTHQNHNQTNSHKIQNIHKKEKIKTKIEKRRNITK